jgi:Zn-dependent metalloprotease
MKNTQMVTILLLLTTMAACGRETSNSQVSAFSREQLQRHSEDEFSPVNRRLYYGGVTLPFLSLPHDAERGILVYENGIESRDVRNVRRIARALGQDVSGLENVDSAELFSKEVIRFYREQFGRNSFDDNAATINISVDVNRNLALDPSLGDNAAWMSEKSLFFFGAGGQLFKPFAQGSDVVGHEFTHAVVSATSNLEYKGQSGALNEHFADVFGEMFQAYTEEKEPGFLIGEGIMKDPTKPLRDMLNPAEGLAKQPGHVNDIPAEYDGSCVADGNNDNCGVHTLSGIPNRYSALVIQRLGWLKVRDIFFKVMTERLQSNASFFDYAEAMSDECSVQLAASDCDVLRQSLTDVGLL